MQIEILHNMAYHKSVAYVNHKRAKIWSDEAPLVVLKDLKPSNTILMEDG